MLTALARCWSAALLPTRRGLTCMATSRRPPALRAVTTPVSPGFVAMVTPMGRSTAAAAAGRTGAGRAGAAGAGAGCGPGGDEGRRDVAGGPGGFDPGLEEGSGTGRLPVSEMERVLSLS